MQSKLPRNTQVPNERGIEPDQQRLFTELGFRHGQHANPLSLASTLV